MVIERFRPGCREAVYERVRGHGRLLPRGLDYVQSWVEPAGNRCFQLMTTSEPALFAEWIRRWADLVDFEVVEVGPSPAAATDADAATAGDA